MAHILFLLQGAALAARPNAGTSLAKLYANSVYANTVDAKQEDSSHSVAMDRELQLALGQRIRHLRQKAGYSQEAFADHCGVHRTFMGTIERGESNLSFQNLAKMASGFGITISKLVQGVERQAAILEKQKPSKE